MRQRPHLKPTLPHALNSVHAVHAGPTAIAHNCNAGRSCFVHPTNNSPCIHAPVSSVQPTPLWCGRHTRARHDRHTTVTNLQRTRLGPGGIRVQVIGIIIAVVTAGGLTVFL